MFFYLGFGNVTIRVLDMNDNEPYFEKDLYEVEVAETAPVGFPVLTLAAKDADNENVYVLKYVFINFN